MSVADDSRWLSQLSQAHIIKVFQAGPAKEMKLALWWWTHSKSLFTVINMTKIGLHDIVKNHFIFLTDVMIPVWFLKLLK